MEPNSILAGWTGAATNVVVRLNEVISNDTVTIYNAANTAQLPLGTVNLGRTDYTSSSRTFGATGTASTMVMSGNTITFTLGTQSGAATTASSTDDVLDAFCDRDGRCRQRVLDHCSVRDGCGRKAF